MCKKHKIQVILKNSLKTVYKNHFFGCDKMYIVMKEKKFFFEDILQYLQFLNAKKCKVCTRLLPILIKCIIIFGLKLQWLFSIDN